MTINSVNSSESSRECNIFGNTTKSIGQFAAVVYDVIVRFFSFISNAITVCSWAIVSIPKNAYKKLKSYCQKDTPLGPVFEADLVYGFREPRIKFLQNLSGFNEEEKRYLIIDTFNNQTRNYNLDFRSLEPTEIEDSDSHTARRGKEFNNLAIQFEDEIRGQNRYYSISNGSIYQSHNNIATDPYIKARCKIGMLWAASLNKKIHYVLDGVDFNICFNQKNTCAGKKYTYSEIRFLYRNWQNLKPNVIFYQSNSQGKFNVCQAPWEESPEIIGSYKSKGSHKSLWDDWFKKQFN